MLRDILKYVQEMDLSSELKQSMLGVEIEEHRILKNGRLSNHPYPSDLGSRQFHPYLQSDFAESQNELITDPHSKLEDTISQLNSLQTVLHKHLRSDEAIWPLSMPPVLTAKEIEFIKDNFDRPAYAKYRDYLTEKYGIQKKIVTGIHVNFSLPNSVLKKLYSKYESDYKTFVQFKNAVYFGLAQQFVLHRYFLTYFLGASPIAEKGFYDSMPTELSHPVRSIRNSTWGYVNRKQDDVNVTVYSSLKHYVKSISNGIAKKNLYSAAEFYGPVRLRGQESYLDYPSQGIDYLEFRVFDNDPFDLNGISAETLTFLKTYLLCLFINAPEPADMHKALKKSFDANNQVALESPTSKSSMEKEMRKLVVDLKKTATTLSASDKVFHMIQRIERMIDHPELTPSGRLSQLMVNGSLQKFGSQQAFKFKADRQAEPDVLPALDSFPVAVQKLVSLLIEIGARYKFLSRDSLKVSNGDNQFEIDLSSVTEDNYQEQTRTLFPELF
ncbi:hypothetical protein PL11_000900 [Lentilactobacillus curieae]|uniref:Glutamate--cysteine ligase n=1 Tax=Lentilactobacillus curieae TaxID=1138822 RepID=A0A1S6QG56_9LACO|nr:hypothetical protein [Lentilactobacillus curieae]AQW20593.1 hypothetical protein PL11_000900 [Lentilactobacillus curieae]